MARALYLFPTKALAQDQARALSELVAGSALASLRYGVYDGDTEPGARARLRRHASIILSNPDMLNAGILPNHTQLEHASFGILRYVVLDEAHVYRGIFGSHVALLMRRLRRICADSTAPSRSSSCCSATIANGGRARRAPDRPAGDAGRQGRLAAGPRRFVLWNPPLVDRRTGQARTASTRRRPISWRAGARGNAQHHLCQRARKLAELIYLYARDTLRQR